MIQKPSNWENVQEFSDRPKLPLGAYVCKIKRGEVRQNKYGSTLNVLFDICEGDYTGFFMEEFKTNTMMDKKYKGILRQFLPKNDGSDKDEFTKSSLKSFVNAVESSNPGYKWDWNEESLAGKIVGIIFRKEEWEYNRKTGWAVRPFRVFDAEKVRRNEYTTPKDKPLKNKSTSQTDAFASLSETVNDTFGTDGQLPWDTNESSEKLPF